VRPPLSPGIMYAASPPPHNIMQRPEGQGRKCCPLLLLLPGSHSRTGTALQCAGDGACATSATNATLNIAVEAMCSGAGPAGHCPLPPVQAPNVFFPPTCTAAPEGVSPW
jgi:hypothetical protein